MQGLRLVDRQILLFHLALTLVGLGFEVSVDLLDDGGIAVVVDHTERLDLAELPVGGLVRRLVRPLRVSLGIGADAFVEGEEDAEVSHLGLGTQDEEGQVFLVLGEGVILQSILCRDDARLVVVAEVEAKVVVELGSEELLIGELVLQLEEHQFDL